MKKKKLYSGGRKPKALRGPMQQAAQDGRQDQNRNHKSAFKDGRQDARDSDGLVTVTAPKGTMRSPAAQAESKRQPVTRSTARDKAVANAE
jgi:hypothetical protein